MAKDYLNLAPVTYDVFEIMSYYNTEESIIQTDVSMMGLGGLQLVAKLL